MKLLHTLFDFKGNIPSVLVLRLGESYDDYYNESVGSFRPEQNKVSTDALDAILYDMVKLNA